MDIWKSIKDSYQTISDKTNEMTKIGRIKLEILAIKRDLEKLFIELGGRVYDIYNAKKELTIFKDEMNLKLISRINEKENKLKQLQKKMETIKQEENVDLD